MTAAMGRRELQLALSRYRGLLAAGLAAGAVATSLGVLAPRAQAGVGVLVAGHDLAGGTALSAGDLRRVNLPRGALPDGVLTDPTVAVGRVLAAPMRRDEPLTDVRLAGAALLAAGSDTSLVAVPVRVADAASAALVTAGDRVDVLAARSNSGPQTGSPVGAALFATAVASDAAVLAVPTAVQDGGDGALIVLATRPAVAARLAAAAVTSRLSLTVRPRP
ncbi:MAG: hypothetical protein NVSMB55_03390 [Mycobacteriales bacterium]